MTECLYVRAVKTVDSFNSTKIRIPMISLVIQGEKLTAICLNPKIKIQNTKTGQGLRVIFSQF